MSPSLTQPALLRRIGLALALVPVLLVAWLGGSAYAAIAGLQQVSATSATNSTVSRSATATCPSGKQVTGAGGGTTTGLGQVMLRQVRPDAGLTSVTATAQEDQNGFAGTWAVRAVAICAPLPAGLERVSLTSGSDSFDKAVVAGCPAGKRLLGTGGEIGGGARQVALDGITPDSTLGGVTVLGLEDADGTTANWSVTAYAICSSPVAGGERVVVTSPTGSPTSQSATAVCPAGKQLTGLGGDFVGGGAAVVLGGVEPAGLTQATVVALEGEGGTTGSWSVRAYAICADVAERVVGTSGSSSQSSRSATASCPAGKKITGAGADITSGGGQVVLDVIVPTSSALTGVTVFGDEYGNGFAGNWFLRSYAICAPPMPGLELIFTTTAPSSPDSAVFATAFCPAGKQVVGVGGHINGGVGEVVLTEVRPDTNLSRALIGASEEENGFAGNWSLTGHVICATTPAGLQLVSATSDPASDPAGVTATCPSGKTLLGTGAKIENGGGQVVLDDVRPNALLKSVTVTGLEDETGFASDWFLRAHAICANP